LEWGPGKNVAWSTTIPGSGWSSPIVWGDRVFVTSAVPDKAEAKTPGGMRAESTKYPIPNVIYDWRVLCLSLKDGSILWQKSLHVGKATKGKHDKNSFATETPCTDGKHLFVYFSQLGLYAFDFEGRQLWKVSPGVFDTFGEYGTSSSPITDGERVYLQCDNEEKSFIAAYDVESGKTAWRTDRDEATSWSTPFLWENAVRRELVTLGPKKARSYDPATGRLLWELGGMSKQAVPIPVADRRCCYISSGMLADPRNRPIFAVLPGATGEISLPKDATGGPSIAWRNQFGAPYVPSPLLYKGRMFIVHDRPLFDCLSLETGKQVFPRQRLPKGGNFTASPVAYRDSIVAVSENGLGYVIEAADAFKVRRVNPPLDDDGLFLASPALAGSTLLLRGAQKLHCLRESKAR
jgi:outer membrane protein assembly factor BamB